MNKIMYQLSEAINHDGYNINDINSYFTIRINDPHFQQLNRNDILLAPGQYWYNIEVMRMSGSKYFDGIISGIFIVEN